MKELRKENSSYISLQSYGFSDRKLSGAYTSAGKICFPNCALLIKEIIR